MASTQQNCGDGDEDEEEDSQIRTVKTQLKNILRPAYRDVLIAAITEKSIISTKLCCLASLLFLHRTQRAFDECHDAFFRQKGDDVIRQCFLDVCQRNAHRIDDEFRAFAAEHQIEWPDLAYLGNGLNDLIKTYTINVKNNLNVHQAKRLRQFLLMKVYELNESHPLIGRYTEKDINHVISWAIYGRNAIEPTDIETVAERTRRNILLDMVVAECWYDIPHKRIGQFTKREWFKSIQFWISLQRKIDVFNTTEDKKEYRQIQRAEYREKLRCRRRNHRDCTCKAEPETQSESDTAKKGPPRVRNLSVIPICNFKRTHYTLDNSTLYSILCETNINPLVPNEKGKRGRPKRLISRNEFFKDKDWYWNVIFDVQKIHRLVHCKKKFRNRILSNGQSVSLQFDVDEKHCTRFDKETIARELEQNKFEIEGGSDPGVNTWNATTVRDTKTGKEVNYTHSLCILHLMNNKIDCLCYI